MNLSKNLKLLCRERGISLSELARRTGVKQPTLHGWANGRKVQKIDDLKKVAQVLEIGLHRLLYGTYDPFEIKAGEILEDIFKGDVRISIQRIGKER